MSDLFYHIYLGDVLDNVAELKDESVDLVVFSPPYYVLRDYGVDGQWGLEEHPNEYIEKFVVLGKELKKVLKKSGSMYINLGDTYWGSGAGTQYNPDVNDGRKEVYIMPYQSKKHTQRTEKSNWLQPKQLLMMPARVSIALQNDGWILRNQNIWHKPNAMPSSVTDRLTNTYEVVYHFVKSRKYYYDLDSIRAPHAESTIERKKYSLGSFGGEAGSRMTLNKKVLLKNGKRIKYDGKYQKIREKAGDNGINRCPPSDVANHPLGKNPGDIFTIPTQTSKWSAGQHFAIFPEKLIIPIMKSSCPKGGVVLDPFIGSGTVMKLAFEMDRSCIGIELQPKYFDIIKKKCCWGKQKLNQKVEWKVFE